MPKWVVIWRGCSPPDAIIYRTWPPFDYIGLNLTVLLALAYIIIGLVIIHAYAGIYKYGGWGLLVFYILIAVKWTMLPLIGITLFLGISDQWIDFRRRFAGVKQGG